MLNQDVELLRIQRERRYVCFGGLDQEVPHIGEEGMLDSPVFMTSLVEFLFCQLRHQTELEVT